MSSSSLCRRSCPRPQLTPSLSSKIAASSASKVESSFLSKESSSASKESSSASKESSSASKDLRGKHNVRRRFLGSSLPEDDDHRIMRGKYKGSGGQGHPGLQEEMGYQSLARLDCSPLAFITRRSLSLSPLSRRIYPPLACCRQALRGQSRSRNPDQVVKQRIAARRAR
ncbi:hypothetical protein GGF50DRAFT_120637 [Schizophyllum commune]